MEMMDKKVNSPLTSSCGRLFDAVSFLVGLAPLEMEYEAESAMRLEAAASPGERGSYQFSLEKEEGSGPFQVSFSKTIQAVLTDIKKGVPVSLISARFHNTMARLILRMAQACRSAHGIRTVVFAGGVFLNRRLLETAQSLLEKSGFDVLRSRQYSPNDESLSIGQIAYGLARQKKR
jgi:hydrogenase maturation protein HypF